MSSREALLREQHKRKLRRLKKKCMDDFETFAKYMMPELNQSIMSGSAKLLWGPHHTAMCKHLQAVTEGRIDKLGISVPPGSSKTSIATILWPLWMWLREPELKTIHCCHDLGLSLGINTKKRLVLKSKRYQQLFKPQWDLIEDTKNLLINSKQGESRATAIRAGITGNHADIILLDDPCTPAIALTKGLSQHVEYYDETLDSRRKPGQRERTVVVMQRLGDKDIIGVLEEREYFDVYLCIPCEYDSSRDDGPNMIGWSDWRTEDGECIYEEMYPKSKREQLKQRPRMWATQYQQSPVATTGNIIDKDWWKRYDPLKFKPSPFAKYLAAWDLSFDNDGKDNDYTVGQVWCIDGANAYLIDMVREKMNITQQTKAMIDLSEKYPQCQRIIVEKRANGSALMNLLKNRVRGLIPWTSSTAKDLRIASIAGYIESGNVYVPNTIVGDILINEATAYPVGHDDAIDCAAIALIVSGRNIGKVQQTLGKRKNYQPEEWEDPSYCRPGTFRK
jgi:predicted phage terminase large subunit-like protein